MWLGQEGRVSVCSINNYQIFFFCFPDIQFTLISKQESLSPLSKQDNPKVPTSHSIKLKVQDLLISLDQGRMNGNLWIVPCVGPLENYKQKDNLSISHTQFTTDQEFRIITISTHTQEGEERETHNSNSNSNILLGRYW